MTLHPTLRKYIESLIRPKTKAVDPASAQLWRELKAAEMAFSCCRMVRILHDMNQKQMWFDLNGERRKVCDINYCPECGRKL